MSNAAHERKVVRAGRGLTEVDVGRAQGVVGDVDDGAGDVFRVRAARFVDGLDQVAAARHARSLIMSTTRESEGLTCSS